MLVELLSTDVVNNTLYCCNNITVIKQIIVGYDSTVRGGRGSFLVTSHESEIGRVGRQNSQLSPQYFGTCDTIMSCISFSTWSVTPPSSLKGCLIMHKELGGCITVYIHSYTCNKASFFAVMLLSF